MKRELLIFRDGHPRRRDLTIPLLDGEQGNMQTLNEMARIVREDRTSPDLRLFILREVIGSVRGHDAAGEVQAVFDFAQRQITYRQDPFGVERVADVWSTLYALNPREYEPEGDCGIKSTFIASCLATLGYKPFFVVAKQTANQRAFNHVFNAVMLNGVFTYLDATPEDKPLGWHIPNAYETGVYEIFK